MEKVLVIIEKEFVKMEKKFGIIEKEFVKMEKKFGIIEKVFVKMEKDKSLHMFRNKQDMLIWVKMFTVLPECFKISENDDTVNYSKTCL